MQQMLKKPQLRLILTLEPLWFSIYFQRIITYRPYILMAYIRRSLEKGD